MSQGKRGLLASLFRADAVNMAPDSDYWYSPVGMDSSTGIRVTPDTAMRLAPVYACVAVRAETLACMPLYIYRRLEDGGKERADEHPLFHVLHVRPNKWQTPFEFYELLQTHHDMRGNGYAQIVAGENGPVDQLVPIHPDRVRPYRLQNGDLRYDVRRLDNVMETWLPEEMFHYRGKSQDGINGMGPLQIARETVGMGLGAQEYGARFFKNDARPGMVLSHPGVMKKEQYERLKQSVQENQTGPNRHKTMVLEEGVTATTIGVTNKDAQFLEARKYQATETCSLFRVPPHMIGILDRSTHSNIEHQGIEFKTYTMVPIACRFEQAVERDLMFPLIGDDAEYFAEFALDGIDRGDLASRYAAYAVGMNTGFLCANDARRKEGMNPIEGGDQFFRPLNMTPLGGPGPDPLDPNSDDDPADTNEGQDGDEEGSDDTGAGATNWRLRLIAQASAQRMMRRECAGIGKALQRHRGNAEKFSIEIAQFYTGHAAVLVESLRFSLTHAAAYCESHRAALTREALEGEWEVAGTLIKAWEFDGHEMLASMAVEGK